MPVLVIIRAYHKTFPNSPDGTRCPPMFAIFLHADTPPLSQVRISAGFGPLTRARSAGLVVLVGLTLCTAACLGGTIRHDRDPSLYTSLAALPQYDSAGMVKLDTAAGTSVGSGTLIASRFVLTAGHMAGDGATFTVNGNEYASKNYWRHPLWNLTDPNDATRVVAIDIGIIELDLLEPISGVLPATLYEPFFGSEVGLDGTMVGFGYTGFGDHGEDMNVPLGTKRAGQNSIDTTGSGSPWGNWSPNLLLVDFDSPDGSNSKFGLKTPLDLEMGPAHGDSGGGLFVELGDQTYLAGVQSLMWYDDGTDNADYGDGGVFVSVRQTFDWIKSIAAVNRPPIALDDSYQVGEDQWLDAAPYDNPQDVLANDSDLNGDSIYAEPYEGPSHGSLSLESDGSFSYLADDNYFGADSFSYRAYDGHAYSQPATVTIDVTPINDPPLAVDDAYEIAYGDEFSAAEGVLANDSDVEDDDLTVILRDRPAYGSVELQDDGTFVYRPDQFFSGADGFTYLAYDGQMYSRLSAVSILVEPAPMPGDANRDGKVDAADATRLAAHWRAADTGWSDGDFNADGTVDDLDATILAANWQAAGSVAVPEPHNLTLLVGLLVGGLSTGLSTGRRHLLERPLP